MTIVCANSAIEKLIKERMPKIKEAFDTKLSKDFDIKTTTKEEFEAWERMTYGEPDEGNDPEFDSLMSSYIPDLDFE